jgi:AcrR family transcriptional regulator
MYKAYSHMYLSSFLDISPDRWYAGSDMRTRSSPGAQDRIMEAALEAFNIDGVPGVSADTIIEQAGVAKMTLYKHFPTKEALAAAFVHERSDRWIEWLTARVKLGRTPRQRLLALFDALDEWLKSDDYFGCPFHRASADFPDVKHPIHKEVIRNKRHLRALVTELVRAAGLKDQAFVVNQLLLLMAGAEIMAQIEGDPAYTRYARRAANAIIRR